MVVARARGAARAAGARSACGRRPRGAPTPTRVARAARRLRPTRTRGTGVATGCDPSGAAAADSRPADARAAAGRSPPGAVGAPGAAASGVRARLTRSATAACRRGCASVTARTGAAARTGGLRVRPSARPDAPRPTRRCDASPAGGASHRCLTTLAANRGPTGGAEGRPAGARLRPGDAAAGARLGASRSGPLTTGAAPGATRVVQMLVADAAATDQGNGEGHRRQA